MLQWARQLGPVYGKAERRNGENHVLGVSGYRRLDPKGAAGQNLIHCYRVIGAV